MMPDTPHLRDATVTFPPYGETRARRVADQLPLLTRIDRSAARA